MATATKNPAGCEWEKRRRTEVDCRKYLGDMEASLGQHDYAKMMALFTNLASNKIHPESVITPANTILGNHRRLVDGLNAFLPATHMIPRPITFEAGTSFVEKLQRRFHDYPQVLLNFVAAQDKWWKGWKTDAEFGEEVMGLLMKSGGHDDLMEEFWSFMPDAPYEELLRAPRSTLGSSDDNHLEKERCEKKWPSWLPRKTTAADRRHNPIWDPEDELYMLMARGKRALKDGPELLDAGRGGVPKEKLSCFTMTLAKALFVDEHGLSFEQRLQREPEVASRRMLTSVEQKLQDWSLKYESAKQRCERALAKRSGPSGGRRS